MFTNARPRPKPPSTFRGDRVLMFGGHGAESRTLERFPLKDNQYVAIKAKCGDASIINPSEMIDFFDVADAEIKIPRISTATTSVQIPFYSFGLERDYEYATTDTLKVYRPPRRSNTAQYEMVSTIPNLNLCPFAYIQLAPPRIQDILYRGLPRTGAVFGIWMSGIIPQTARPEIPDEIKDMSRILEPYYMAGHIPDEASLNYEAIVFAPGGTEAAILNWKPFADHDTDELLLHFRRAIEHSFKYSILPFSEYIQILLAKKKKSSIEELTIKDLGTAIFNMKWALDYISEKIGSDEPFLFINPSCRTAKKHSPSTLAAARERSASPVAVARGQTLRIRSVRQRERKQGAKKRRATKRYRRQK